MTGLTWLLLAAAGVLLAGAKFLHALLLVETARAEITLETDFYEDVDGRLLQRQTWDRPNLRSIQ